MGDINRSRYFFGFNLPILGEWKNADYILGLTVVSVGAIVTVYGLSASANSETAKDTRRYPLAQLLLFSSLVISVVGIM
jgi:hypothetical protein